MIGRGRITLLIRSISAVHLLPGEWRDSKYAVSSSIRRSSLTGDVPELTAVEVLDGFSDFFVRVHHERPTAHDWFMDGLTAEQQHDGVIGGFDGKAAAA
jgi:hypothetical protein